MKIVPHIAVALVAVVLVAADKKADSDQKDIDASSTTFEKLKLNIDALKTWKTKVYSFTIKSSNEKQQVVGSMTFTTLVKPNRIILHDVWDLTYRGQKLELKIIHHCKKNSFLTPVRIESEGKGSDEVQSFTATIKDGNATVKYKSKEKIRDVPSDTVTTAAMMRLVTLVPTKKGTRIKFDHWLESSEMNLKKDYMLESLGEEAIERSGNEITCTKFRLTGKGIGPAYYWVDSDHVLQRVLIDDRKMIDLQDDSK